MTSASIFVIAVGVIIVPIVVGGAIGFLTSRLDSVIAETKEEIESKDKGYNPNMTMGYRIKVEADKERQLHEARILAAKKAAQTPRGANMRIGRLGEENLQTAGNPDSLKEDPWTATKVAAFHGWDGAMLGIPSSDAPPPMAAATGPAPTGKIVLVPGKDYEYIEITDDMDPADKRKARIANSKAKSKAMKAAKAAGAGVSTPVMATSTAAAPAAVSTAPAVPTNIPEPNYIEISDDMAPDEKRKARIHNSKEKSKYNKALKAAGLDPKAVAAGQVNVAAAIANAPAPAAPAPVATPAAAPVAAPTVDVSGIPKPDYVELRDDMTPDEKRAARIANSKAKSAYNKALKAAGIDPKSVK